MNVGQPAAGAAGLVELLFVRLDLAVDEVESLLRGAGQVQQVVAAEAVGVLVVAEVHWLRGYQDAHRGTGLDHGAASLPHSAGSTRSNGRHAKPTAPAQRSAREKSKILHRCRNDTTATVALVRRGDD